MFITLIHQFHIDHNAPCLPPKFSITIVLDFSWDDRNIQTGNNGYVKFWGAKQGALWSM